MVLILRCPPVKGVANPVLITRMRTEADDLVEQAIDDGDAPKDRSAMAEGQQTSCRQPVLDGRE